MSTSGQQNGGDINGDTRRFDPQQVPRSDVTLQKYSLELIGAVDEMRKRRDTLHKQILNDEKEKEKLQQDIRHLTGRLVKVNEGLCDKVVARNALDETIVQTSEAFEKLVNSSENLTAFMKRVTASIRPMLAATDEKVEEESTKEEKKKRNKKSEGSKR